MEAYENIFYFSFTNKDCNYLIINFNEKKINILIFKFIFQRVLFIN